MMYNRHAAHAPFIVAAVCQHWRALALATSNLWTYFGFPQASELDKRHLRRLELLEKRAGAAPIDVVFGWHSQAAARECREHPPRLILERILGLHLRWKTVVLHVEGSGWEMNSLLQSSQWPLLESLSLSMNEITTALPAAPRLRRLWLSCYPSSVDGSFTAGGYPLLTVLSIFCGSNSLMQSLVSVYSNQLVELVLLDDCDEFVDDAGHDLTRSVFPALQCLTLDDADWLQYIDAPVLKRLLLTYRKNFEREREALCRFDHLQELQLCGEAIGTLTILAKLSNITTLTFCPSRPLVVGLGDRRDRYDIDTQTLREIASLDPPIWPRLQRLHFTWFDRQLDSRKPAVDAQDLVDFVSARNAKSADSDHGQPATARIVEVVANYPGAPDWLEDKLKELTIQ